MAWILLGTQNFFFVSCSQYAEQFVFHMWCLHLQVAHKFADKGLDFEELFYVIRCDGNEQEGKDKYKQDEGYIA